MHVTSVDWRRAREVLEGAAHRVAGLLRTIRDPQAPGTGEWTAVETAAHLTHTFAVDLASARGEDLDLPPPMASPVTALGKVSDFNADNLGSDGERDLAVLATRIEEIAANFLSDTADSAGDEPTTWLGGGKLPVSALA